MMVAGTDCQGPSLIPAGATTVTKQCTAPSTATVVQGSLAAWEADGPG